MFNILTSFFSLYYYPLIITPLWRGPCCVSQSLLHLGLFTQSLLLLRHSLSLIADIVSIGCSVDFGELHSSIMSMCVYLSKACFIEPICLGYFPLLRNWVECKIHFLSKSCRSNLQTHLNKSKWRNNFCHKVKEIFICWLNPTQIAGFASEHFADCASWPQ